MKTTRTGTARYELVKKQLDVMLAESAYLREIRVEIGRDKNAKWTKADTIAECMLNGKVKESLALRQDKKVSKYSGKNVNKAFPADFTNEDDVNELDTMEPVAAANITKNTVSMQ